MPLLGCNTRPEKNSSKFGDLISLSGGNESRIQSLQCCMIRLLLTVFSPIFSLSVGLPQICFQNLFDQQSSVSHLSKGLAHESLWLDFAIHSFPHCRKILIPYYCHRHCFYGNPSFTKKSQWFELCNNPTVPCVLETLTSFKKLLQHIA